MGKHRGQAPKPRVITAPWTLKESRVLLECLSDLRHNRTCSLHQPFLTGGGSCVLVLFVRRAAQQPGLQFCVGRLWLVSPQLSPLGVWRQAHFMPEMVTARGSFCFEAFGLILHLRRFFTGPTTPYAWIPIPLTSHVLPSPWSPKAKAEAAEESFEKPSTLWIQNTRMTRGPGRGLPNWTPQRYSQVGANTREQQMERICIN